jgi:hypothetical protein
MQPNKYPSIIMLKEIEVSINMLINEYHDAHESYVQSISLGNSIDSERFMKVLDTANKNLKLKINEAGLILKNIIPKGEANQNTVTLNAPKLKELSKNLNMQESKLKKMRDKLNNIDGNLETSNLDNNGNYTQLLLFSIIALSVIAITITSLMSSTSTLVDNIFIVMAIISIIYYILLKFINK